HQQLRRLPSGVVWWRDRVHREPALGVGRMTGNELLDEQRRPTDFVYLVLAAVFISSLVVCNLIANKFLTVDLGFKVFTLSAGALPYPLTFLATDLLSELYGQKRANRVVWAGFAASLFALLALWLGAQFDAIE